jgi:hypothetical protein
MVLTDKDTSFHTAYARQVPMALSKFLDKNIYAYYHFVLIDP